jgi:hypothetical protein
VVFKTVPTHNINKVRLIFKGIPDLGKYDFLIYNFEKFPKFRRNITPPFSGSNNKPKKKKKIRNKQAVKQNRLCCDIIYVFLRLQGQQFEVKKKLALKIGYVRINSEAVGNMKFHSQTTEYH